MFKQKEEYIKNCYFCLHGRPRKNNLCSVHKIYVTDIQTYTCPEFLLDKWMIQDEEPKAEEEGDQRFFYLNFNLYICS
jgi:hypothetical protein